MDTFENKSHIIILIFQKEKFIKTASKDQVISELMKNLLSMVRIGSHHTNI